MPKGVFSFRDTPVVFYILFFHRASKLFFIWFYLVIFILFFFRGGQLPGGEGMMFKFNMAALAAYLKKQSEQGTKASYYNIDILKYQVFYY